MKKIISFEYSKNDAKIISGIALLMMLIHHFWGFPYWLNEGNICISIFSLKGTPLKDILAGGCQLCIPIFAFNTGYVLYKRRSDFTFLNNFIRIARFLLSYWIVYLLFMIIGSLMGKNLPSIENFLLNLIGLNCGNPGYISVPFAWYVNFYISFIFISPLILYLLKKKNLVKDVLFLVVWILFMGISISSSRFIDNAFISTTLKYLFTIGLTSVVAFMTAKYELFSKLDSVLHSKTLVSLFVIIIIVLSRYFVSIFFLNHFGHSFGYFQDCIYTPIFIFSALTIVRSLKEISKVKTFLYSVGTYSMNMWFLHGIFFVQINEIQRILYLPKYSIIVLIWGFMLTYPLAIIVSKIQSYILKYLKL